MNKRCAMGSDDYVLRLAKVREEEQAWCERVRKAEQAVIRAAKRAAKQAPFCPCPGCQGAKRALARLDALTMGER